MKYIDLFENYSPTNGVEKITKGEYTIAIDADGSDENKDVFTEGEISIIKSIKLPEDNWRVERPDDYTVSVMAIPVKDYLHSKDFDKLFLYIHKCKDSWFYIQAYKQDSRFDNPHFKYLVGREDDSEYLYYKCDQRDGLKNMMKLYYKMLTPQKSNKPNIFRRAIDTFKKKFESKSEEFLEKCWRNSDIGDVLPESDIYQYVQGMHHTDEDFWDGDLGDRIENYSQYKLREISISKIDIDEFYIDEDDIEGYQERYESSKDYPPIVLEKIYMGRYTIIDGTHRVNALNNLGITTVKAWVGV